MSINNSQGVSWSGGVSESNGVNGSFGVFNSCGVDKHIFCADKKRTYHLFKTEVSEERFDEVSRILCNKLNDWHPQFDIAERYEAWKDMPEEAIEYLKNSKKCLAHTLRGF